MNYLKLVLITVAFQNTNGKTTYTLSGPDASKFTIDNNGNLILTQPADYETQNSLHVTVTAFNAETGQQQVQNLIFNVDNLNDRARA